MANYKKINRGNAIKTNDNSTRAFCDFLHVKHRNFEMTEREKALFEMADIMAYFDISATNLLVSSGKEAKSCMDSQKFFLEALKQKSERCMDIFSGKKHKVEVDFDFFTPKGADMDLLPKEAVVQEMVLPSGRKIEIPLKF